MIRVAALFDYMQDDEISADVLNGKGTDDGEECSEQRILRQIRDDLLEEFQVRFSVHVGPPTLLDNVRAEIYAMDFGGVSVAGHAGGQHYADYFSRLMERHPHAFFIFLTTFTCQAYMDFMEKEIGQVLALPNVMVFDEFEDFEGQKAKVRAWLGEA